jgi:hypothetical protein
MNESVKINFNDGSFLLLEQKNDEKLNITMCGRKNINSVVMSSSDIDKKQAIEIVNFINIWLNT